MPRPILLAIFSPVQGRSELVFDGEAATIGRDEACALRLDSMTVEREHARLVRHGEDVWLEDLVSKTGVKVNGARVARHRLARGDEIEIASFVIKFDEGRRGTATPGEAPVAAPEPESLPFQSRLGGDAAEPAAPSRVPSRPRAPLPPPPPGLDLSGLDQVRNVLIGDRESNLIAPAAGPAESQSLADHRPPSFGAEGRAGPADDLEARARAIHSRNVAAVSGPPGGRDARADVADLFDKRPLPEGLAEPQRVRGAPPRGLLEWVDVDESALRIGGMEGIKRWISRRRGCFSPAARQFGIDPPRGALLLGLPGCGKRMAARAAAFLWELSLARLPVEELLARDPCEWLGALDAALDAAERAAPCVVLLAELDRFARLASPGSSASRVMGQLVSWLRRPRAGVAAWITAGEVAPLPGELKRRGELVDEVFLVELPTARERWHIWPFALERKGRAAAGFDAAELVRASEGRTGAELARAVEDALHEAFHEGRALTTGDLLRALDLAPPLASAMEAQLARLRVEGGPWAARAADEDRVEDRATVHDLHPREGGGR